MYVFVCMRTLCVYVCVCMLVYNMYVCMCVCAHCVCMCVCACTCVLYALNENMYIEGTCKCFKPALVRHSKQPLLLLLL